MSRIASSHLATALVAAASVASVPSAQELEIHTLSVLSGDCALVISPTGTTMLIDTGRPDAGTNTVIPYLQSLGITDLDYVVISHYDGDHIGGLPDFIAAGYTPTVVYDRGDFEAEQNQIFLDYVAAAGAQRTQITTGMTIDLGGGAVMQHWIQNGQIWNGPSVGVAGKVENAKSSGWVLSYGDFSYGSFGDIAIFLEDHLAPRVGNLDVYKASHHGSSTSSGINWINQVDPDVTFVSSGPTSSNPKQAAIDSINRSSAMRWLYMTSDSKNPTAGGNPANDHMVLRTNGTSYTISGPTIPTQGFLVDEATLPPAQPGDIALAEFMTKPDAVAEEDGEYIEITNLTDRPLPMRGWEFSDNGTDSVTIASNVILEPRGTMLIAIQGEESRNGGIDPTGVWPRDGFRIDNGPDEIKIDAGMTSLVDIQLPGLTFDGQSWERENLYNPGFLNNFSKGITPFGDGDLGTPGERNAADVTAWTPLLSDLSPKKGFAVGGKTVTLTGFDLDEAAMPIVLFGFLPSPNVEVVDANTVRAEVPGLIGKVGMLKLMLKFGVGQANFEGGPSFDVDVTIINPNGSSSLTKAFRYVSAVTAGPQLPK